MFLNADPSKASSWGVQWGGDVQYSMCALHNTGPGRPTCVPVKVKITPEQATKAQRDKTVALLFL